MTIGVFAQIPCDEQYGNFCPEESGWGVGDCLKKHESELSSACSGFVALQDICKDDIIAHCPGKEYTGDVIVCLSEWTSPDLLSDNCKSAIPKKVVKEKKKLTAAEKKKADARRRVRNSAANTARAQQEATLEIDDGL